MYIERMVMHATNAPYPPSRPQPYCGSTTLPCYYPYTQAYRADAVRQAFAGHYSLGYAQNFPYKEGNYDGVWAKVTSPNVDIVPELETVGAPVSLTDRYNSRFIESGPSKKCTFLGCAIHPYGNWDNGSGDNHEFWDTTVTLSSGSIGEYKSNYVGDGRWASYFCNYLGCSRMVLADNIGTSLPYVFAGGESTKRWLSFGTISVSEAKASSSGSWSNWCYNPLLSPWRTGNGSVTGCNSFGWTVNY